MKPPDTASPARFLGGVLVTTVPEAALGIVSECIYAPLSALVVSRLLR